MKVFILAGGLGTRISEESYLKPKPMIEIGGKPILWHIMKIYSHYGFNEFVILGGYKSFVFKEYFSNYFLHNSDVTFNLKNNSLEIHQNTSESWSVTVIDTGEETMTGGRLKRARAYLKDDEDFCLTYGDGLAKIDLNSLIASHKKNKKLATITAVQPPGRFGLLDLEGDSVKSFLEKPQGDGSWINGGFFILNRKCFDFIDGDSTIWEKEPLENLARQKELGAYFHHDFWQPMDTLRDKKYLDDLWNTGKAPWKIWN